MMGYTEDCKTEVREDYKKTRSSIKTSKNKGVPSSTIISWSKKIIGHALNGPGCREGRSRHSVDEDIFNTLDSPEKFYWLGIFAADGCIYYSESKNSYSIEFGLNEFDVVSGYAQFIGFKGEIKERSGKRKNPNYRIRFASKKMFIRCNELGITQRKTHTLKVSDELSNNKSFWAGFIDGDGRISFKRGYLEFNITKGSEGLIDQFIGFCEKNTSIRPSKYRVKGKNAFRAVCGGHKGFKILSHIYEGGVNSKIYKKLNEYNKAKEVYEKR